MVVVARMVGMLVGISALTTIGLHRYYAKQDALETVTEVCGEPKMCSAYRDLQKAAGVAQEQTVFTGRGRVRGRRRRAGAAPVPRRRDPLDRRRRGAPVRGLIAGWPGAPASVPARGRLRRPVGREP